MTRSDRSPNVAGRLAALLAAALLVALWLSLRPAPEAIVEEAPAKPVERPALPRAPDTEPEPVSTGWTEIRCLLPVETWSGEDLYVLVEDPDGGARRTAASIRGGELEFAAPRSEGAGLVQLVGYERAGLLWFVASDGTIECLFPQDPQPAPRGTLRLELPEPGGPNETVYATAGTRGFTAEEGEHTVEAWFPVGPLEVSNCRDISGYRRCDPTRVQIEQDRVTELDLALLDIDWRLPGVSAVLTAEGARVIRVEDGSEAELAGIARDDLVISADGLLTAGRDASEVDAHLSASEDDFVEIEVRGRDGSVELHQLPR